MNDNKQYIHPELLKHYEQELHFVREMGKEFAQRYSKVAEHLDLNSVECADPYVERLLEGFAFLSARIQIKLQAEFPKFTQHLLETVYPHYLSPIPAMSIIELTPDREGNITENGVVINKGEMLRSNHQENNTHCLYRTAHTVKLWPIEVTDIQYLNGAEANQYLPKSNHRYTHTDSSSENIKSGIKIQLDTFAELPFNQLSELDELDFFIKASPDLAGKIYEMLFANTLKVLVNPSSNKNIDTPHTIEPIGFNYSQSLLPYTDVSFEGYRLLQEYFNFPERFLFFKVTQLKQMLTQNMSNTTEIIILFDQSYDDLHSILNKQSFALNCTPIINLFKKTSDRVNITHQTHEHHIVIDRSQPMSYEVYQINNVLAFDQNSKVKQIFKPFYACNQHSVSSTHSAYYTLRREPRLQNNDYRNSRDYIGTEVFISLVDQTEKPYQGDLKELSIDLLCTNRHLPQKTRNSHRTMHLSFKDSNAPVNRIQAITQVTEPQPPHPEGDYAWRLISHLSLNYLSLLNNTGHHDKDHSANALKEILSLYIQHQTNSASKQIDGITHIDSKEVVRRLPHRGPITFGRGLEITVTCKESAFEGSSAFLLVAVLEQFFAKYVSINSFTQTRLKTLERGLVKTWPARCGTKAIG
ncbi:MAG TPA: type VI secretion system baseplate subunit TssF [Thiothrix sp.]|nr:type VI secretion system baseplate subunit TssF [Thiothrix sp.]